MKQRGSAHALLIIGLVIALVGTLGFVYWQNFLRNDSDSAKTEITDSQTNTESTYQPTIPDGWMTASGTNPRSTYSLPKGETVTAEVYVVDELIHVGYGAPVFVKYSSSSSSWQKYAAEDSNDPVLQTDTIVKALDTRVEDKYEASYYTTGDGLGAESRVLVVAGETVYQYSFTGKIQSVDFMNSFVQTITLLNYTLSDAVAGIASVLDTQACGGKNYGGNVIESKFRQVNDSDDFQYGGGMSTVNKSFTYAYVQYSCGTSGAVGFMKQSGGIWTLVGESARAYPMCSVIETQNFPRAIVDKCYVNDADTEPTAI